jgi:putative ABC transport system permease protein
LEKNVADRWAGEVRPRLTSLRLSPERESEIVDELSQHLEEHHRELTAGGASDAEATRQTLALFRDGNLLASYMAPLRQSQAPPPITPGVSGGGVWGGLWQDLRFATRMLTKQPGFAATAVLTLALGIGATTAIFSVVYGVLLKPLPFDDAASLVSVRQHAPHGAGTNQGPATYLTYLENQRAFEGVAIWDTTNVSITGGGEPERVQALLVSANTLPLLRVRPVEGQFFTPEDDTPGAPLRAVLTHAHWQRWFGGRSDIAGQRLIVDGRPAEVIGVLPASFTFLGTRPALLLPLPLNKSLASGIRFEYQALARLKPGVSLAQANDDAGRVLSLLPPVFAQLELRPDVRPLADDVIGDVGQVLWILLGAVAVVLLIACGNVANLFLVRAEGRHPELAMRAALGASRGRIARVLLSESLVLALAGGAAGVALAAAALGLLRALASAELPRVDDIGIDTTVLSFTLAISLLSGLLFGLFAVARFGTPSIAVLKEGGRSASDGPGRRQTRNALVVGQVALALTLLIVSGLMIRTFLALRQVDPGFANAEQIQTFVVAIPPGLVADPRHAALMHQSIVQELEQVPGVVSVGLSTSITMDGEDNTNPVHVEGFPTTPGRLPPLRRFKTIGPGYFEAMGNPIVAGRGMTWADVLEERPVIVVSAPLVREYWGEPAEALGQRIRAYGDTAPWREIIGVSGDERDDGLHRPATAIVYWPMLSEGYSSRTIAYAVRSTRVGTPGFLRELQQAVWTVNPNLPLAAVQTVAEIQARSMGQTALALVMLAIAAAVALAIGLVGIYGVTAYAAAQRTREIGVRVALGAQIGDVRALFLRHGVALIAAGIVLGLGVAVAVTRVLSALLYGVQPIDPITYAVGSAVLAGVALLAVYLPARRAARVDPVEALRGEA